MAWVEDKDEVAQPAPTGDKWQEEQPTTWSDTINDFGRATSNAVTFGMANRAKAAIDYGLGRTDAKSISEAIDEQAKKSDIARERSPVASTVGDVYGSLAIPGLGAETLAARLGSRALGRAIGYGVTGAAQGAVQGAGNTYSGNPMDYVQNAGVGAGLGAVLGGVGGAAFGRGPARSAARAPAAADLDAAADISYDALRRSPAQYTPESFSGRAYDIENQLRMGRNAHEGTSPQSFRTVGQMHEPPTATAVNRPYITPADADYVRRGVTGDQYAGMTPTDQGSASVVRRGIDDFITNPPPGAVVPGTEHFAREAAETGTRARDLYAGARRTEKMEDLIHNAENSTGATYSGLNAQNQLRRDVRTFIKQKGGESPASKEGYNADEIAALRQFTRGTWPTNTLRYVSNAMGGGGGSVGIAAGGIVGSGTGAAVGKYLSDDPSTGAAFGAATPVVGLGLRMLGNRRAGNEINALRDLIAQRNPLYQHLVATSPMVPGAGSHIAAKGLRDSIANALIQQRDKKERR
jgi:hypothetical protein